MKMSALVLMVVLSLFWIGQQATAAETLEIHCLDVGQGDCTIIISPDGTTMMVDAGRHYTPSNSALCKYLSDSTETDTIDYLLLTHYDADHIGGVISLFEEGRVVIRNVLDRGQWDSCTAIYGQYAMYTDSLRQAVSQGQVIDLGAECTTRVVSVNGGGHPEVNSPFVSYKPDLCYGDYEENVFSIALVVEYGDFDFFVGGDLLGYDEWKKANIEEHIAASVGDVEVYQVNHHGSKYSSCSTFVQTLGPEVAVISIGSNDYPHPHPETLQRLDAVGAHIYQTEYPDGQVKDGNIVITTTGIDSFIVNGEVYPCSGCCRVPGDANRDGNADISDLTYYVDWMFGGGSPLVCMEEFDNNDDCALDISDLTIFIDWMFGGGSLPGCLDCE